MPYKNAEKRKAKSRDAARSRRGKEADVFSELSSFIPVPAETVAGMDKASVMRLAISHLKLRTLMGGFDDSSDLNTETNLDHQYEQALGGFLVVMDKEGEFVYVSDNVVKHIGLAQLDLLGQTIQEYSHPCDHEEIEEFLSEKHSTTADDEEEEEVPPIKTFFARLKSTLTNKGRNVNLKSATYKVIRFRGHRIVNKGLDCWLLIGESIPHPSQADLPIENSALITRHSLDTKFTYCDERMEEVLGYTSEELENKSLFEFHHAQDGDYMDKIYKDLFSKGQVWTDHYRFLVKHGGFKWIETQATVVHNPKTDKPQYIICIHSVLSGIEEEGKILSTVQEAAKVASPLKKKVTMAEPVKVQKGPILSTESIFVPRTKEMDSGICAPKQKLKEEMETEMGQIAPTAGDEIIPLRFDGQDSDMVSLLQDVLLQASEMDNRKLSQFHLSLDEDEANQALKETPEVFFTTPTGNKRQRLASRECVNTTYSNAVTPSSCLRRPSVTPSVVSNTTTDSGIQEDITDKTLQIKQWLKSVENCRCNPVDEGVVSRSSATKRHGAPVYTSCTTIVSSPSQLTPRTIFSVSSVPSHCVTYQVQTATTSSNRPCSLLCGTLNQCVPALQTITCTEDNALCSRGGSLAERKKGSSTDTCSISDWGTETASEKGSSDIAFEGFNLEDYFVNSTPEDDSLSMGYDFLNEDTELHKLLNDLETASSTDVVLNSNDDAKIGDAGELLCDLESQACATIPETLDMEDFFGTKCGNTTSVCSHGRYSVAQNPDGMKETITMPLSVDQTVCHPVLDRTGAVNRTLSNCVTDGCLTPLTIGPGTSTNSFGQKSSSSAVVGTIPTNQTAFPEPLLLQSISTTETGFPQTSIFNIDTKRSSGNTEVLLDSGHKDSTNTVSSKKRSHSCSAVPAASASSEATDICKRLRRNSLLFELLTGENN